MTVPIAFEIPWLRSTPALSDLSQDGVLVAIFFATAFWLFELLLRRVFRVS